MSKETRYTLADVASQVQKDFNAASNRPLNIIETETLIKSVFSTIKVLTADSNADVRIHNFGMFSLKQKPARTCRNPQTGGLVLVAPSEALHFKPSKSVK